MNDRIPFKRKNEAMRRIGAARRRMVKLVGKPNLGTEDPLMAEIQLAQLDALLAIAYSMAGIEARIEIKIDEKAYNSAIGDLRQRIGRTERELHETMKLVSQMHGTQILERNKPSWWDRLTGRE